MLEKDGIEIVSALAERKFAGGLILISGGDGQFLKIARTIAIKSGLDVLGPLIKPFNEDALAHYLKMFEK